MVGKIPAVFAILLLFASNSYAQKAVHPQVTLMKVVNLPTAQSRPVRLNRLPNGNLVYGTLNGSIYEVVNGSTELLYQSSDHQLSYLSSMDVHEDQMYICGSIIQPGDTVMIGYVYKGDLTTNEWSLLAESDPYYLGNGFNDHRFSSLIVDRQGEYVYVHSGTRTNAGEVHELNGVKGTVGLRDQPLRGKLFKIPTELESPVHLSNDSAVLAESGYVHVNGLRHCFALAWGPDDVLYGASNSDRRDVAEAFYKIDAGRHYGFPWWIGGEINPLQFSDYDVDNDKLAGSSINNQGYYDPDSLFPTMPLNVDFVQPYKNIGPDGDRIRDSLTGAIIDASEMGLVTTTFTGHRSPTGLKFDLEQMLPDPFTGDAFMVSFGSGLDSDRRDLLRITLLNGDTLSAEVIADQFNSLLDVFISEGKIYLLESGSSNGSGKAIYEVTLGSTTALTESEELERLKITPNPATSSFRILDPYGSITQVRIVDVQGKVQKIIGDVYSGDIDISGLNPGTYWLVAERDGGEFSYTKMVKL